MDGHTDALMFDTGELFSQVNRLKMCGKVLSNNFLQKSVIEQFSVEEKSMLAYNQDAIALICCENGIARLYFYISCLEKAAALRDLLRKAEEYPVVVADCVGQENYVNGMAEAFCKNGFSLYARLTRWRSGKICLATAPMLNGVCLQTAVLDQTEEILAFLYRIFDPYESKLPNREQMADLIGQKLVFCAVENGRVIGVVCLQKTGRTGVYIYQVAVSNEHRSAGVGSALLQFALRPFNRFSTFTSWIKDGNEASRRLHQALGMQPDGLVDAVLLYRAQT